MNTLHLHHYCSWLQLVNNAATSTYGITIATTWGGGGGGGGGIDSLKEPTSLVVLTHSVLVAIH